LYRALERVVVTSVRMLRGLALGAAAFATAVALAPSALATERSHVKIGARPAIDVHLGARPAIPFGSLHSPIPRSRFHDRGRFLSHGAPIVLAAPPPAYLLYDSPAYVDPSIVAAPPPSAPAQAAPPPPPPPERDVVRYSDGRFELRGDGIATPYRWVWIPNAPPPPASTARDTPLYGWTDDQGAMHVTDQWEKIPPRYREQAKRNKAS
jgi:hypothetical protein